MVINVKNVLEHFTCKELCKELMRTYDPIKKDDKCHFQMIHTLTHRSHNFAFGECLPYRPMRWL